MLVWFVVMVCLITFVVLSVSYVRLCRTMREKNVQKAPVVTIREKTVEKPPVVVIRDVFLWSLIVPFLCVAVLIILRPINARNSVNNLNAGVIADRMHVFARDHGGKYPNGKSSTEIFQKLLDDGYVRDPSLFFISMEGKTKPVPGQPLKPENVGWDVTTPIDTNMPSPETGYKLPVVFSTGYKVSYLPGAAAVPLLHPYPQYNDTGPPDRRNWFTKLYEAPPKPPPGIWVCYYTTLARFLPVGNGLGWVRGEDGRPARQNNPGNLIPNFIPTDFDAQGKRYQQLTPNGILVE